MSAGFRKLLLLACIALLAAMPLAGCARMTKGLDEAKTVSASYFDKMMDKDYDGMMALYSDLFFEKTDKEDWKDTLAKITEKLGDLESYKLSGWDVDARAGKGTFYTMTYNVKYSKYDATEVITLYRPDQKSPLLIAGQNINSEGFLK